MPNATQTEDLETLDFCMDVRGTPIARTEDGDVIQTRLERRMPLAPTVEQTTKVALLAEVKARSLTVITEFDRQGYAYIYLKADTGWYRYTARKFRRGSSDLQSMLWDAAKSGLSIAVCPQMPSKECA